MCGGMDVLIVGWKNGHMNGRMGDGLVDRWKGFNWWTDGWLVGLMDRWMDG
jgi:hypothetical protein